jgi:Putative Flp pilus-assembly TadE/G-like/Protein of unknown function (DUF642)
MNWAGLADKLLSPRSSSTKPFRQERFLLRWRAPSPLRFESHQRVLSNRQAGSGTRTESGATVVVFALFATTMVGFVSLAVDVGNWMLVSSQTQNAADAAALAAATRSGTAVGGVGGGPNELALQVAARNGILNNEKTQLTVELISKTRITDLNSVVRTSGAGFRAYSSGTLAEWKVEGPVYFVDTFWPSPSGTGGSIDLHAVGPGSISRFYDTVVGKRYRVSWKAAGNNVEPTNVAYTVAVGGVTEARNAPISAPRSSTGSPLNWSKDSVEFIATTTSTQVRFASAVTAPGAGNGAVITSIVFDELDEILRTASSPQVKVTVTRRVPTYFASIFGASELVITKSARAEYRAALPTGSVGSNLGSDPERAIQQNFWLSAASPSVSKIDGQRYAAANCPSLDPLVATFSTFNCPKLGAAGTNPEYKSEGQLFDIEVDGDAAARGALAVQVYDPAIAEETGDIGINPPTCSGVRVPHSDAMAVAAITNPGGTSWPVDIDMVEPVYPNVAQLQAYATANGLAPDALRRYLGGPILEADGSSTQLSPWCTGERLAASTAEALKALPALACPSVRNPDLDRRSFPDDPLTIESCQYPMDVVTTFDVFPRTQGQSVPVEANKIGSCSQTFSGVRFAEERTGSVNASKGGFGTKSFGGTLAEPTAVQATVANLLTPGDGAFDGGTGPAAEFARTFHRWVTLCDIAGGDGRVAPGTYTLRAKVASAYAATNFFSVRASTGSGANASEGITISPRSRMAVYMFTPSVAGKETRATFHFIRIPSNAKGATAKLELFDIGDVTALPTPQYKLDASYVPSAKIEVLASNTLGGAAQSFSECSFTVRSGPISDAPEAVRTPDCVLSGLSIATHDGRMMAVTAKIPDNYNCDDAKFDQCWLRVRVTYPPGTQPTDITSWEASIDRPIVRLLPNA